MAEKINISNLRPIGFINQQNPTKLPEENNNVSRRNSSIKNQQQIQQQNNQPKQQSQQQNNQKPDKDATSKNSEPKKPDNIKKSDIVSDEEFDNIMFLLEEIEFDTDEQKEAALNLYKRIWENQKKFSSQQKKDITSHHNFQKLRNLYTDREDENTPKYLADIKDLFNFTRQKNIKIITNDNTPSGFRKDLFFNFDIFSNEDEIIKFNKNILNLIISQKSGQNISKKEIESKFLFLINKDLENKTNPINLEYLNCIVNFSFILENKKPIVKIFYLIFNDKIKESLSKDKLNEIKIEFESLEDLYNLIKLNSHNINLLINSMIQYSTNKSNIDLENDLDEFEIENEKLNKDIRSNEEEYEEKVKDFINKNYNFDENLDNILNVSKDTLDINNYIQLINFPNTINENDPIYSITLDASDDFLKIIVNKHFTLTNKISDKKIKDIKNVKIENIHVSDNDIKEYQKSDREYENKSKENLSDEFYEIKNNKKKLNQIRINIKENMESNFIKNKIAGNSENFDKYFSINFSNNKITFPTNLNDLNKIITSIFEDFKKQNSQLLKNMNDITNEYKKIVMSNKEYNKKDYTSDINQASNKLDVAIDDFKTIKINENILKKLQEKFHENINNFEEIFLNFFHEENNFFHDFFEKEDLERNEEKYLTLINKVKVGLESKIEGNIKNLTEKSNDIFKEMKSHEQEKLSIESNFNTNKEKLKREINHLSQEYYFNYDKKQNQLEKIKNKNISFNNPYKNVKIKLSNGKEINLFKKFNSFIQRANEENDYYEEDISILKSKLQDFFIFTKSIKEKEFKEEFNFISNTRFLKIISDSNLKFTVFVINPDDENNPNDVNNIEYIKIIDKINLYNLSQFLNRLTNYNFDLKKEGNKIKIPITFENENVNESFILRLKNKKLLLEELIQRIDESNQEKISKEEIKNKVKKIEKLEKEIEKVEDHSEKKKRIEDLKKFKESVRNEIDYKIILNISHMINSLKDAENPESQKVISTFKKSLGFEPSVLNFALNSLSKFKSMCEINRIISNVVLSNVINILMELNIVYYISTNEDVDSQMLKDMYVKYESNFNSLYQSFKSEEVIDNFEKLVEKVKEDFGASSEITNLCTKMYNDIIKNMEEMNNRLKKFKMLLSKYWEEYSSLEEEKKKIEYVLHLIDVFENLKESKEMKNLYVIYTKNKNYFLEDLKMTMLKNVKLNFDKILENENKETFVNIYSEEKLKFDKVNNTCVELLGKNIGEGKLGKVFSEISVKKKELIEKLNNAGKEKEETKNKEQKKVKSEENPENKKQDNINTKPEQENKSEDKRDKNESKLIKQDLKILNNKNSKLKLIVKG